MANTDFKPRILLLLNPSLIEKTSFIAESDFFNNLRYINHRSWASSSGSNKKNAALYDLRQKNIKKNFVSIV